MAQKKKTPTTWAEKLCKCGHKFQSHEFEECVGRICSKNCRCLDFEEKKDAP